MGIQGLKDRETLISHLYKIYELEGLEKNLPGKSISSTSSPQRKRKDRLREMFLGRRTSQRRLH